MVVIDLLYRPLADTCLDICLVILASLMQCDWFAISEKSKLFDSPPTKYIIREQKHRNKNGWQERRVSTDMRP